MKILLIATRPKGGIIHYTVELANALSLSNDVTVVKPAETAVEGLFADTVTVEELFEPLPLYAMDLPKLTAEHSVISLARGLLSYRAVRRIRDIDPDVVHLPAEPLPHLLLALSHYEIDRTYPLIMTHHEVAESVISPDEPLWANLVILAGRVLPTLAVDHDVVHVQRSKKLLVRRGRDPEDVTVIPHGAFTHFRSSTDDVEGVAEERNTLLFFGRIIDEKNVGLIVDAVAKAREEIEDITLIIAGQGDIPEKAWNVIERHPETFEVYNEYIGDAFVDEVFSRAEIVVPYAGDSRGLTGHSGVLTIAYAYHKPIVTTDVGEYESWVAKSGCGEVVPPGDADRFAKCLVGLLENDERRAKMKRRSAERAKELSWENVAEAHQEVYDGVLREAGRVVKDGPRG